MTTLASSKTADDVGSERRRSAAFIPHFWPEQGLSRYSLGAVIATSEGSLVRFGVVGGAAQFARLLAIKQVNPTVARQAWRLARFKEEARIHARIQHPNVVELLDVVESGADSWLVLEHVDGATLGTILAHRRDSGRPLELELAAGILTQLLRGLHAVHETKDDAGLPLLVTHSAVSPRHVMVDRHGQVKLLDFGLARAGESTAFGLRRAPGRFGHLSPELVIGDSVDRRSDVFAAGILLWEAIAGRSLFDEPGVSDADGLRRVLRAPIPELRAVRAETPRALSNVVHKALQRDPSLRFATAQEFALALEAALRPASPPRLATLANSLGENHFEPSRRALAAARRLLPPPLTRSTNWRDSQADEDTALALTGRFKHGDTLSPANTEVAPVRVPVPAVRRPWLVALVAAALGVTLVVAFRRHPPRSTAHPEQARPQVMAAADANLSPSPSALPSNERSVPPAIEPAAQEAGVTEAGVTEALAEPIPVEALPLSPRPAPSETDASRPARKKGARGPGRSWRASIAVGARAAECSPPTYLGDDGIRHFKAQCL